MQAVIHLASMLMPMQHNEGAEYMILTAENCTSQVYFAAYEWCKQQLEKRSSSSAITPPWAQPHLGP